MKRFARLREFVSKVSDGITPSEVAWRGAAVGIIVFSVAVAIAYFVIYFVQDFTWTKLPAFPVLVGVPILLGVLCLAAVTLVSRIPVLYRVTLFLTAPFIFFSFAPGSDQQAAGFTVVIMLLVSFVGAGIASVSREGFTPREQKVSIAVLLLGVGGLLVGLYAVFSTKESANPLLDGYVLQDKTLALPNPGLPRRLCRHDDQLRQRR